MSPFHKLGEYKCEALKMNYKLYDISEPHQELIQMTNYLFEMEVISVFE